MGKTKLKKRLKRFKPGQFTPRDAIMALAGAGIMIVGVYMSSSVPKQHVALAPQSAAITTPWVPQTVKQWDGIVREMAKKYNIDPNLIAIIMTIESGGNPKAQSGVGAQGLMQVMPATAKDIAAKHLKEPVESYDIYDPRTNIEFGTAYLAWLRDQFGADAHAPCWNETVELVAAGYNGGPGAAKHIRQGDGLESTETVSYSRDAFNMWRERHALQSPTYNRWLGRGGSALIN